MTLYKHTYGKINFELLVMDEVMRSCTLDGNPLEYNGAGHLRRRGVSSSAELQIW